MAMSPGCRLLFATLNRRGEPAADNAAFAQPAKARLRYNRSMDKLDSAGLR
jgi:hypothetical protein